MQTLSCSTRDLSEIAKIEQMNVPPKLSCRRSQDYWTIGDFWDHCLAMAKDDEQDVSAFWPQTPPHDFCPPYKTHYP